MAFEKIDASINNLLSLTSKLQEKGESVPKIISEYITAFDQLFEDGLAPNSIQVQINSLASKNTKEATDAARLMNFEYVQRVSTLKDLIEKLPDDFPHKSRLVTRIADNCSSEWLEKFKQNTFTNSEKDFFTFRKSHERMDWNNTVEIKTWGTTEELGNGLKNVLRREMNSEAVGHASLVMRIPVNEENRKLIDKYCRNENGSSKIPHEIKQYGNQPVYEIYWSFWPGRLNKMKEDIEDERSGFAFTTKSNVLSKLPPEVRDRHVFEKQTKDFFGKQHTIHIAPAATPVVSQQYSTQREQYINLKLEKYKLEEQIKSLETLKENYLDTGKEFDTSDSATWEKTIKHSSNFLTFLSRFKNEFPDNHKYAQVLKNKKITHEVATMLTDDVDKLIEKKEAEIAKVKQNLKEANQSMYAPSIEIKNLKKEIKRLQSKLEPHQYLIDAEKQFTALKDKVNPSPPDEDDFEELLNKLKFSKDEQKRLLKLEMLPPADIDAILEKIEIRKKALPNPTPIYESLKKARDDLEAIYKNPKEKTIEIYTKKTEEKSQLLNDSIKKLEELQNLISKNPEYKSPVNFVYNNKRTKTEEEKATYGNAIYTDSKDVIWKVKSNEGAKGLVDVIQKDIEKIKSDIQVYQDNIINTQLHSTHTHTEQLKSKHIIKGTPTNNVVLRDFNIEEMLKKASELASTTSNFDLMRENCSTTSMKLLNAGAPSNKKHMFQWTENTPDNPAKNAFLTNPQAVHAACTVVSKAQDGDPKAEDMIKRELLLKPNTSYHMKLNKLLAFTDDKKTLLSEIKSNAFSYLKIIPNLIKDLLPSKDSGQVKREEAEIDKFLNKLNDAIRTQNYVVVTQKNPLLAIDAMKEKLQASPTSLPFFDEKTLKIVKDYVLDLKVKDPKTEAETKQIEEYKKIINEREERVSCIEHAVAGGHNVTNALMSRTDNSSDLKWELNKEAQAEKIVNQFIENYNTLRKQAVGPTFLRSNFVATLPKNASFEDQLKVIFKHVQQDPTSRSATAWKKCSVPKETLENISQARERFQSLKDKFSQDKKNFIEKEKPQTDLTQADDTSLDSRLGFCRK